MANIPGTYRYLRYGSPDGWVGIDTSSRCQLNCPLCFRVYSGLKDKFEKVVGDGYVKFDDFRSLIDKNPWISNIEISNNGEIFLNPELKDIIRYAYERGIALYAGGGVNLNYMSEDMAESLVKYKVRHLRVSLDSATPEIYKIYRVNGDFNRVISNVKEINRYKRKYNSEFPYMTWQFVIFGHNEHELPIARKKATELGMSFLPVLNAQFWDPPYSPVIDREFVKKETGINITSQADFKTAYKDRYCNMCTQLWVRPQINWDGKLLGCCWNTYGDYGNVFDRGLTDCLKSEKYLYTKRMLLGLEKVRGDIPCASCHIFKDRSTARMRETIGFLGVIDSLTKVKVPPVRTSAKPANISPRIPSCK